MHKRSDRANNQLRNIIIETFVNKYADGSCIIQFGNTKVLCTASIDNNLPNFLKNTNQGWITAEYAMLPRATHTRIKREAKQGRQNARSVEIQRLIGRSLRSITDLSLLDNYQIIVDCDVLQADGGTRVAAICGSYVATYLATYKLYQQNLIKQLPFISEIAAVSCGIIQDTCLLDLDYAEDSHAELDSNFVMNENGEIIEMQISSEQKPHSKDKIDELYKLAFGGIKHILEVQRQELYNALTHNKE